MSAYDEILELLRKEIKERNKAINLLDKNVDDASFTAYLVFRHGTDILKLALTAIKKEQDEQK